MAFKHNALKASNHLEPDEMTQDLQLYTLSFSKKGRIIAQISRSFRVLEESQMANAESQLILLIAMSLSSSSHWWRTPTKVCERWEWGTECRGMKKPSCCLKEPVLGGVMR